MKIKHIQYATTSLTLVLFILLSIFFTWYNYLGYSLIPQTQEKLWNIATDRADEIDNFLNEQEKNAVQLSQKTLVTTILHDIYYAKNNTPLDHEHITNYLSAYKEQMFFKNIFIVDSNANIIASTAQKNLLNINLRQKNFSEMSASYERASMTFTNDFSYFNYNALLREPALFITIPILEKGKYIGALIYQIDQQKIFLITNQYIDLGKTGEVTLTKKESTYVVFVSSTRHDPDLAFKKINSSDSYSPVSVRAGLFALQGVETGIDYRGKNVVFASKFIPKLDWGMVIKIDLAEIAQHVNYIHKFLLIFFILFIISFITSLYYTRAYIIKIIHKSNILKYISYIPSILKNPFFIVLLICLSFALKNIIYNQRLKQSMIKKAQDLAIQKVTSNAEEIETKLATIEFVGKSIAQDLQSHHLMPEDISIRLNRDIRENNAITTITILFNPYSYDKSIELYAPSITKENDTYKDKVLMRKCINDEEKEASPFNSSWYTKAIQNGFYWQVNAPKESKYPTATYSCVFLDNTNKQQGVIIVEFSLTDIVHIAEYSSFGQTGYSIILTDNGTFIFHPMNKMIQQQTTLLQLAQSQGNSELAVLAQKIMERKSVLQSYSSAKKDDISTLYTYPISINNWVIGAIFPENEVRLASTITRHYYFWILIWIVLALIAVCGLLYSYSIIPFAQSITATNLIFIAAILCSWYIIQKTTTINRESKTIITDQTSLNKFLNDLNEEAHRKHEPQPITIPFGLFLFSLNINSADQISISGYIWSKYNTLHQKNISRSIDMPQATKIQFGTPLISTADLIETVTVNAQGTLFEEQNYTLYPFDQQQIRIIFEHRDIEKNIILTPDLAGYKKISPEATPGLDKEFTLSGFSIEQAFFEYHTIDPTTNFGFKEYGKITDNYQLIYNVIMNRNLLNPFILYLLPLLVILFSLFCTLIMTIKKTDPFSVLGPYTGLFFALVILHRSLREQFPTGGTLYMEYAFFYTYISIILLIIHTILTRYYKEEHYYREKILHLIKLLFWPFQLVMWLMTTLIVFY